MNATDFVILGGGLAVPLAPVRFLMELEDRQIALSKDGDDLVVSPRSKLTDHDRDALRRWKSHLIALLTYEPPRPQ